MSRQLIGQILRQMGRITPLDVDEILTEQSISHRRFGEIALMWGLVQAEHLATAWCRQLEQSRGDAAKLGGDPDAIRCLPADAARRLAVLPMRLIGNDLIVACARPLTNSETAELSALAGHMLRIVEVDAGQLERALDRHYPRATAA